MRRSLPGRTRHDNFGVEHDFRFRRHARAVRRQFQTPVSSASPSIPFSFAVAGKMKT